MIIDPTLSENDLVYFPGLRFKGQQGLAKAMQISKPKCTVEDLPIFLFLKAWRSALGGTRLAHLVVDGA